MLVGMYGARAGAGVAERDGALDRGSTSCRGPTLAKALRRGRRLHIASTAATVDFVRSLRIGFSSATTSLPAQPSPRRAARPGVRPWSAPIPTSGCATQEARRVAEGAKPGGGRPPGRVMELGHAIIRAGVSWGDAALCKQPATCCSNATQSTVPAHQLSDGWARGTERPGGSSTPTAGCTATTTWARLVAALQDVWQTLGPRPAGRGGSSNSPTPPFRIVPQAASGPAPRRSAAASATRPAAASATLSPHKASRSWPVREGAKIGNRRQPQEPRLGKSEQERPPSAAPGASAAPRSAPPSGSGSW